MLKKEIEEGRFCSSRQRRSNNFCRTLGNRQDSPTILSISKAGQAYLWISAAMTADTFYGGSALSPPIQRPRRSAASGRAWKRAAAEDAGVKGLEALIDATLFGDGSIQSRWLRMGASHGDEVPKCLAALGHTLGTSLVRTFSTPPLPKRLGKPKSEIQSSNYSNISKPFPLTDCLKARWMQLRTLSLKT